MFFSGCGGLLGDKKDDEGGDSKKILHAISYDPAQFYTMLEMECLSGGKSLKKTATNIAGAVVFEKICSYDASTRTAAISEKRSSDGAALKDDDYQEVVFNESGRPVSSRTWEDSTKAVVQEELNVFYNEAGKLTKTESTRTYDKYKYVEVQQYDADEAPVSSTTTTFKDGEQQSVKEDNCDSLFSFSPRSCERKENGKVVETVTYANDEIISQELINSTMIETERTKVIPGVLGKHYSNTRKSFSSEGTLRYEESSTCTYAGDVLTCSIKHTSAEGKVFYTENSEEVDKGTITFKIGSKDIAIHYFAQVKGDFNLQKKDRVMTGTMTGSVEEGTFNRSGTVSFTVASATNTGLDDVYASTPYWLDTSGGDIDDVLKDDVLDATFTLKTRSVLDAQFRETLVENFDLAGVDTEKVDKSFRMKEVTSY